MLVVHAILLQTFFESHQGEIPCVQLPKDGEVLHNPAVGIVNMIRSGYLALQLLPENSSAGKESEENTCIINKVLSVFIIMYNSLMLG